MSAHSRDVFLRSDDPGDFIGRKDGEFDDRGQREMTLEPFTNLRADSARLPPFGHDPAEPGKWARASTISVSGT